MPSLPTLGISGSYNIELSQVVWIIQNLHYFSIFKSLFCLFLSQFSCSKDQKHPTRYYRMMSHDIIPCRFRRNHMVPCDWNPLPGSWDGMSSWIPHNIAFFVCFNVPLITFSTVVSTKRCGCFQTCLSDMKMKPSTIYLQKMQLVDAWTHLWVLIALFSRCANFWSPAPGHSSELWPGHLRRFKGTRSEGYMIYIYIYM